MDSLKKILNSRQIAQPPDDIKKIKDFVSRRYNSPCKIRVQRGALILSVPSSGLAANMQLERELIIEKLKLTDKLVIRSGR